MSTRTRWIAFLLLSIGTVAVSKVWRPPDVRSRAADLAAVRAVDRAAAAHDSTRTLDLGDALDARFVAVQRRAVQAELRADVLDGALRLERRSRAELAVTVASLRVRTAGETVHIEPDTTLVEGAPGEPVRRAHFSVRETPWTVQAEVVLPPPPAPGTIDLQVRLDTLPIAVRLGCGSPGVAGVRSAAVTVVAPAWATVRLARVEQESGVCESLDAAAGAELRRSRRRALYLLRGLVDRFGLTVGLAVARDPTGVVIAGPGLSLGVRVWP